MSLDKTASNKNQERKQRSSHSGNKAPHRSSPANRSTPCSPVSPVLKISLQNISRQILILHNIRQHLPYIIRVDNNVIPFALRSIEAQLIEHPLHDRMQPPRSDILRALVHPKRKMRDL